MKLNLDFTAATLLKDWWKTVKSNFETITNTFNSHTTAEVLDHPDGSVTTAKVKDKAITTDKLADYGVTTIKIAQGAINNNRLSNNSVDTRTLKDKCVTKAKLETDIQAQLYNFQEHMDNPSQEIADGAVTKVKLSEDLRDAVEHACVIDEPIVLDSTKGLKYDEQLGEIDLTGYAPNSKSLYIIKNAEGSVKYINDPDRVAFECVSLVGDDPYINKGDTVTVKFTYPDTEDGIGKFFILSRENVDSELSDTSKNPVQNKVIKAKIDALSGTLNDLISRVSKLEG